MKVPFMLRPCQKRMIDDIRKSSKKPIIITKCGRSIYLTTPLVWDWLIHIDPIINMPITKNKSPKEPEGKFYDFKIDPECKKFQENPRKSLTEPDRWSRKKV